LILLSLALIGFAVVDLLRWSRDPVPTTRSCAAIFGAVGVTALVALLSGMSAFDVVVVGIAALAALSVWVFTDRRCAPGYPLAWIISVLLVAIGLSGEADAVSGPLERWYAELAFSFVEGVPVDQFLLATGAALFLLATANRIVQLVLEAAGTPVITGETVLRGGRILGPMERLFVGAMVLSGDLTGAAIVIAAKGLLRLPEIRSNADERKGTDDQVTEYFLIGTFSSLLLAGALAAFVSAAS
jgi:hypothetical protein